MADNAVYEAGAAVEIRQLPLPAEAARFRFPTFVLWGGHHVDVG